MPRLSEIERQIDSMDGLLGVVGALRALAGVRMQEADRALPGIRRYADILSGGLSAALSLFEAGWRPPDRSGGGRIVVLFTSEHGFVGAFNERMIDEAEQQARPGDLLFVIGNRGGAIARERGLEAAWSAPMATRLSGIGELVHRLAADLLPRLASGEAASVLTLYGVRRGSGSWESRGELVFPLDPAAGAALPGRGPLHNLAPIELLDRLTEDFVLAQLTRAGTESLACENGQRFMAMQAAHDNVGKKLDQLRQDAGRVRQEETTTELLDLVSGSEAAKSLGKIF